MSLQKALNLKDGEQVLYVAHQFPLTHWPKILITFILLILPFFFLFPLFDLGWWGLGIFSVLILTGFLFGASQLIKWYYDVFVVTGERVIDIDQKGLFDRTVSVAPYQNIQDVSYRIKGVWQTIFRYGNVLIDTSSSSSNLEVRKIRHPHVLQELISELRIEAQSREDNDGDENIQALKEFTDKLSISDIKNLIKKLKKQERDEAVEDFLKDE